jgi:aminopeptidase N
MEYASCIFYAENTVTGTRSSEALLAHEIAHQWFGNSATEKSFAHLWLSEGFASYLTHVYLEQKYGRDTVVKRLQEDRNEIIQFSKQWPFPVVDSLSALMDLLNANSYQKGGWVLHLLRQEVGDTVFQNILRTYYNRYLYSNADTWDFEKVAEDVSGKDLKRFFQQWLFTPGLPRLDVQWRWRNGQLSITLMQKQKLVFHFPVTIGVYGPDNKLVRHQINVTQTIETATLPVLKKPVQIVLDPDTGLLFEGTVSEKK